MIRFEKKADPQPTREKDDPLEQLREIAPEEPKKPATNGTRRRARQQAEDDRLI
ncbi:hypothetical protein ABK249_14025 [Neorhizobium sp. Rsf11]|uniref:Uncharacterized protein n=2 Tax=Neorhizobium TaxID=1525371 RepID=A0ABV0M2H6_9HYPH|nr:hypothetical protein [Neorhizobium petrolearium]MCC2612134.1 hypothetical protein [Neorhizobium petrolearium]WGI67287.1 hypothetical protein QEO92_20090 [Neorhizobium petrolearium]